MSPGATASFEHCPNCGADHPGRYCSTCGQKSTPLNPSMRDFFHELTHEVLHLDGKIFRSLRLLVIAPGELTRQLFQGKRSSYVSAIRLYLTFSVLYFAVAAYAPGPNFRVTVGASNQSGWTWRGNEPRSSDLEELQRLGFASERELEQAIGAASAQWVPRIMFLLVPVFAGLAMLATRRSGRNLPQYLYFALHVHAAWFLALGLNAAGGFYLNESMRAALSAATLLYMALYLVLAIRRAFGTSATGAVWRAAGLGASYAVLVFVAVSGVVVPLVLNRH